MPRSRPAAIKWGAATFAALAICGGQTFEATARVGELGVAPAVTTPPPFIFNSQRPSISGLPIVGNVLSATKGEWSGTEPLSYAFQWQRCTKDACVDIPGETGQTYVVTASDVDASLCVLVSVTGPQGSASAKSDPTTRAWASAVTIRAALRAIRPPTNHRIRISVLLRGPLIRFDAPGAGYLTLIWHYADHSKGIIAALSAHAQGRGLIRPRLEPSPGARVALRGLRSKKLYARAVFTPASVGAKTVQSGKIPFTATR